MRNIWTIAQREYKLYFASFSIYVVAFFILIVIGGVFTASLIQTLNSFGQIPPPSVQIITGPLMFMLIFACPAFTMRLISEEQRLGTLELLLTAPVRDAELVLGKWLGAFMLVITLVAVTWVYPVALNLVIKPGIDQGPLVSGYLGVILVSAVFLGIGVAVSSFFSNQVASYLTTFGMIVLFWWILGIFSQVGSPATSPLFQFLDLSSHFYDSLMRGVIELKGVVYYLTFTALTLLIGSVSVETRRWR